MNNHGLNNDWSFKDEAIKYCMIDCKSLMEVLIQFNKLVYGEFKVNIFSSLTLPSLAALRREAAEQQLMFIFLIIRKIKILDQILDKNLIIMMLIVYTLKS